MYAPHYLTKPVAMRCPGCGRGRVSVVRELRDNGLYLDYYLCDRCGWQSNETDEERQERES